ncbi:MAG: pyridoxal phosphate-dependent aminotransferase, partial [Deltaproteobacteria bacterium]|nr:pyridoxal phosphate-dependent aminotransferase [Deltaproteobacteria bacterium]
PYWVSYPAFALLADATPVILETKESDGFKVRPDQLEGVITKSTKAIILNSPSNPTGAVYAFEELEALADILVNSGILAISDDIYEKIIFDGVPFFNIANVRAALKDQTVVVNGVSKTYAMTGWRIGYAAGPEDIMAAVSKIQSQNTSNPTSISQKAAVEALRGSQEDPRKMVEEYSERRDCIVEMLNTIDGISCVKPQGAFYVFPKVSQLYGVSYKDGTISNSVDLAEYFLDEAGVAVVPGSAFGSDDHLRLSYATSMENIQKGIEQINAAIEKLKC